MKGCCSGMSVAHKNSLGSLSPAKSSPSASVCSGVIEMVARGEEDEVDGGLGLVQVGGREEKQKEKQKEKKKRKKKECR